MAGKRVYPWERLRKPGDYFLWPKSRGRRTLQVQCSKRQARLGMVLQIRARNDGMLVVTYVANRIPV